MNDNGIEFTLDQAEEAVMGYQVKGTLPPNWTRGTLACAILALEQREAFESQQALREAATPHRQL